MPPAPTHRLVFREWRREDLPLARALWGDVRVTALIGGPFRDDEIERRLEEQLASELQYWPIFLAATGEFVGCCGLRPKAPGVLELGFHLLPKFWRQGLAVEAARSAIAYGLQRVPALFAGHHPDNVASRSGLLKLGFRHTHDELYPPTGRLHPSYLLERSDP
jgi:RimJ/RimL family protein N-acetyltransferase